MTSGPLNSHAQDKCTRQRHAYWFPRLRPGETPHFSTFNDKDFAEGACDAQLNDDRLSTVACRYWIMKLQATSSAAPKGLDVVSVIRASQDMSGEIEAQRLIERLLIIALQTAGADRALFILPHVKDDRIAAEAHAGVDGIVLQQSSSCDLAAPESLLRYVTHTRESVILDDAMQDNLFSEDDYLVSRQPRSVLCLPLVRKGALSGLLYLENRMTSHVFTAERTALLDLVASQAAISLENARLYRDLQEREAKVRRLVDANIIGIFAWDIDGRIIDANDAFLRIVGYGREDFVSQTVRWTELTPAEWHDRDATAVEEINATGAAQPYEKELLCKDGGRIPVLTGAAAFCGRQDQGISFVISLTERKQAEREAREFEQQYRAVQMELAHANRIATMGQLTASIAHEVQQPIAATAMNGMAALRWLRAQPANLEEAGLALDRIVSDTKRAGAIVGRIRDLVEKAPAHEDYVDINEAIREIIELTHGEAVKTGVSVRTQLADGLPLIRGDRVQLQQVNLNLIINAIEAMRGSAAAPRELLVTTGLAEPSGVLVAVRDSGPGLVPTTLEHLFDPFYTTKPGGLGMGLSICRSIVKGHGGRLWAVANEPRGAVFQFTLPAHSDRAS